MKKDIKPLDRVDCKIISLLQTDGRLSNTEIAKQVEISEGTVRTRLNRLIKDEFIQIVAVSNPLKLGFKIVGHMRISIEANKIDNAVSELKQIKKLWFIVVTTGGATGVEAEFAVKSMDELNDLIVGEINQIDGVLNVNTTLTLDFVKRRYDWGTGVDID